ncbi:hypothetical protein BGL_1c34000 [Burkholderia plantarii]|uniref:Uncharacterized protein n=1 Tax=Burkholderia plantarii TaxID=41899 RepID=A0A0B6S0H7_BURPL|nr:hypothetical protein BGL_1c34000 [Burkholderia plantarii]
MRAIIADAEIIQDGCWRRDTSPTLARTAPTTTAGLEPAYLSKGTREARPDRALRVPAPQAVTRSQKRRRCPGASGAWFSA